MPDREVVRPVVFQADYRLPSAQRPDRYVFVARNEDGSLKAAFGRWAKRMVAHLVQPDPHEYD